MSLAKNREDELRIEVARLTTLVDELKGRIDRIDQSSEGGTGGDPRRSRRDLLKVAGAGVAGAAASALLGIRPVAAADGNNLVLGNTDPAVNKTNDAGFPTTLTATASSNPTPLLRVVGPNAAVPANMLLGPIQGFGASLAEGLDGYAPGAAGAGVFGLSDAGYGVIGQTSTGLDLAANGTGRIFQFSLVDANGSPIAGPPSFTPAQPPNLPGGELMRDVDSVLWASRATGTLKAAWKRMNTPRFDSADGSGTPFTPVRIVDTRNATGGQMGPLGPGGTYVWGPMPGSNVIGGANAGKPTGIPSDAIALVGNLTAAAYSTQGYLAIFPTGFAYTPNVSPSSLNFGPPTYAWANSFIVGLGTGANAGKFSIYVFTNGGPLQVIVDIVGYIQ